MEKIISQKKYDEIKLNEEKMGPIYDIKIDINNLSEKLIDYSFYDVIYLESVMMDKEIFKKLFPKEEINKINNYIC